MPLNHRLLQEVYYTCGLKADGTLRCWGNNNYGQAPVITLAPDSLPDATLGAAYAQNITASGGSATPYTYSVVSGTTPTGLALHSDGTWSGAPTEIGAFEFTVQAADANNLAATQDYRILVSAPLDLIPPVITPQIAGALGQNGWYVSDVTLSWTVTDDESEITSTSGCGPVSITSDQAETAYTCTATSAGGTSSISVPIKRDATPPVVAVTGVTEGSVYILGAVPAAACSTTDAMSGVGTNAALSLTGGTALGVGQFTATCSGALDNAGNAADPVSVHYNVTFLFTGFTSPVDNPPVMNIAKAGQAVPLKWRITDANGNPITDLTSVTVTAVNLPCQAGETTDPIEEYATGESGLQNLGDGYYQWNWKTPKSYANSCKTMRLDLGEGVGFAHIALFQFKK